MAKPRNVQISQDRRFFQFREDRRNLKALFFHDTACSFRIVLPIHIAGTLRVREFRKVPNIRSCDSGFQRPVDFSGVNWGVFIPL